MHHKVRNSITEIFVILQSSDHCNIVVVISRLFLVKRMLQIDIGYFFILQSCDQI
jgi:hypothetical protein